MIILTLILNTLKSSITGELLVDQKKVKDLNYDSSIGGSDYFRNNQENLNISANWQSDWKPQLLTITVQNWLVVNPGLNPTHPQRLESAISALQNIPNEVKLDENVKSQQLESEFKSLIDLLKDISQRTNAHQPALVDYILQNPVMLQKSQNWLAKRWR